MSVTNVIRLFPQAPAAAVISTTERADAGEAIQNIAVTPVAAEFSAAASQAILQGQSDAAVLRSHSAASPIFGVMDDTTQFVGIHTMIGAHAAKGVKPFAFGFPTQDDAADYIASQMNTSYNGPAVDLKVRNAVRDACAEWKPGQDLAQLVYAKVLAALKGVLPDTKAAAGVPVPLPDESGFGDIFKQFQNQLPDGVNLTLPDALGGGQPRFDFPNTAQAVAYLAAKQIQANGSSVFDVLEHMLAATVQAPR